MRQLANGHAVAMGALFTHCVLEPLEVGWQRMTSTINRLRVRLPVVHALLR